MTQSDVRTAAEALIAEHCPGWAFTFDRAKRRFGCCHIKDRTLSLSWPLCQINSPAQIKETILHEIAHAIAWDRHRIDRHSRQWKAILKSIGGTGEVYCNRSAAALGEPIIRPPAAFEMLCDHCGNRFPSYRRRKRSPACFHCCNKYNGGRYTDRFKLRRVRTGEST